MNIKISDHSIIYNQVEKYLVKGGEPGLNVGFSCLNDLYTHKEGGVTDWTGFPASGKTYFCLEILMNLSEKYGYRHGLLVPDIGTDREVIAKLIKMRTGKDFNDKYHNKITNDEMAKELPWILHHFVLLGKNDMKKGITPLNFWEFVCNYKDGAGKLNTGLLDSWKNLQHIYSGREDLYLDEILSVRNEMAEGAKVHFHTIAHAVKTDQDNSGKRRIPTAWDIKGGGSWFANGKNIITVDFPKKDDNKVNLYISKVKPEDVGKIGAVIDKLRLDLRRGRYYEEDPPLKYFAFDYEKGFASKLEIAF